MKTTQDYLADLVASQAVTNERLQQIAADIERLDTNLAAFRMDVRTEINELVADVKRNEATGTGVMQTNQKKLSALPNSYRSYHGRLGA